MFSNNHTKCTVVYPDLPTEAFFHVYASTLPIFILANESPLMTQALLKPLLWYLEQVFVCELFTSRLSETSDSLSSVCVLVTQSRPTVCDSMNPTRLLCPWNSPGKHTRVGSHSPLQGIFPTQG